MIGLDPAATASLRGAFRRGAVHKTYLAAVDDPAERWRAGALADLDTPLGFDRFSAVKLKMGHGTLAAHTRVRVLARDGDAALLACEITTGRQHQIRVHLAMQQTPIIGDKLYQMGDAFFLAHLRDPTDPLLAANLPWPRHALHAACLRWDLDDLGVGSASVPTPSDFPVWPGMSLPACH
jgi:23S rRNA-/tRNA-specific pseudouridylate synthase